MNVTSLLWHRFNNNKYSLTFLLLLAVLLYGSSSLFGHFYADDYIQRSYVIGSESLGELGLLEGVEQHSLPSFLSNQFNFFDPTTKNYQALKDFGMMPWWSEENIKLHFFRPLASLTHFIEYQLWPNSPRLMHLANLCWYLLGIFLLFKLYSRLSVARPIALLALLIFILNINTFHVITWIASRSMLIVLALGCFTIYSYHRSLKEKSWYIVALLSLTLCLLSAEAGLTICAYLAAYFFTLDQRPWSVRIRHIFPFALLALLWLIAYQIFGFGAKGGDFYLDPGADLSAFLQQAAYRLPASFFELASGTALFSGQVRPDIRTVNFALLGVAALLFICYLLWHELKNNKVLQFCLLGSVFALLPGLSIVLSPRVMLLPSIGFAVVLATLLHSSATGLRLWLLRFSKIFIVLFHLVLAAAVAFMMNSQSINKATTNEQPHGFVDLGISDYADKHLIALNSLQPFWFAFIAHQLDYTEQALPRTLRLLSTNFYTVKLTRLSEQSFILEGEPFLQYDREHFLDLSKQAEGHHIYLTWELMGIFRSSQSPWYAGQQFDLPEMRIQVESLYQNKPQALLITLNKPLTDYRFIYQDTKSLEYRSLPLPKTGESFDVKGVF